MKGQKHLLSNHADIDPTINNAIEHFLFEESSREEHKICSNLVRRGQDVFAILPSFIFLLFSTPRITNVIKGKVGKSILTIIIVAPLVGIIKPILSDVE